MSWQRTITLSNGLSMPQIGLGTFRIKTEEDLNRAIHSALVENNYSHIDTASVYKNESLISLALQKYHLSRKNVFITSKLAPRDHGKIKATAAVIKSLENLHTDYLDLYLIHWPGVQSLKVDDLKNKELRRESWQVLEDFYEKGIFKAIGVSNYNIGHLQDLLSHCRVKPHVNQIEVHPHYQQKELIDFCREQGIHVTAYSSLGTSIPAAGLTNELIIDENVTQIATKRGLSNAQVLLLWGLQKGYSVLPKSVNPKHIEENIRLKGLTLEEEDIKILDELDRGTKYAWNPELVI